MVAALSTSSITPATAKSTEPAVLLKQHSRVQGRCEILYSKSGIKVRLLKKNLVLCMQSPSWRLSLYNAATKRCFQCDPKTFIPTLNVAVALLRPADSSQLKPVSVENRKLLGLSCKRWKFESKTGQTKPTGTRSWQRQVLRSAELWVVESPQIPDAGLKAIGRMLTLPPVGGIPLAYSRTNVAGETVRELNLNEVSQAAASSSDFSLPPGIKLVKDQGEVMKTNLEGLGDLLQQ